MPLEDALSAVEQQLKSVSEALLASDPQALESGSTQLRDMAVQLSQIMDRMSRQDPVPAGLQERLQAVGAVLSMQREGLARLVALTERQTAGLLPPADAAGTYGSAVGGRNAASAARIYRSAS